MRNGRRILSLLVCAALFLPVSGSAAGENSGVFRNIEWELTADGELLLRGEGEMDRLVQDSQAWKRLGRKITKVTVQDGLTCIGENAFSHCAGLRSVTLPGSIEKIAAHAFAGCGALTEFIVPEGVVSIGRGAFSGCGRMKTVTLPRSVTEIREDAFADCGAPQIRYSFTDRRDLGQYMDLEDSFRLIVPEDSFAENYARENAIPWDNGTERFYGRKGVFLKALGEAMAVISERMGETEKAKALHDWLITHAYYTEEENGEPTDLLIDGYGAGTDYAGTYALLLSAAGIANAILSDEETGHAWNLARLEGHWYHIDAAFDDPPGGTEPVSGLERSRYFMMVDSLITPDHTWNHEITSTDDNNVFPDFNPDIP